MLSRQIQGHCRRQNNSRNYRLHFFHCFRDICRMHIQPDAKGMCPAGKLTIRARNNTGITRPKTKLGNPHDQIIDANQFVTDRSTHDIDAHGPAFLQKLRQHRKRHPTGKQYRQANPMQNRDMTRQTDWRIQFQTRPRILPSSGASAEERERPGAYDKTKTAL